MTQPNRSTPQETQPPPRPHPCRDDWGRPVTIEYPHTASAPETWADPNAIVTLIPQGDYPIEINGIPLEPWTDRPEGAAWNQVEGRMADLNEPPMPLKPGLKPASGVVIEEADGRIWVVSPTNGYGGYVNTFPKGKVSAYLTLQANAIKEAYEESGLQVRIVGLIGDFTRSTTVTRYYRAVRVGGTPVDMDWESQAVHLVPRARLDAWLANRHDQQVLAALAQQAARTEPRHGTCLKPYINTQPAGRE